MNDFSLKELSEVILYRSGPGEENTEEDVCTNSSVTFSPTPKATRCNFFCFISEPLLINPHCQAIYVSLLCSLAVQVINALSS